MRTVIIGLGTVSRTHRKALALMDDVELVAVADVKPEKKEELPEGVHFYEDYKEMLDKEKPDAAHICLPHYLHLEAATECAKRGINILCESQAILMESNFARCRNWKTSIRLNWLSASRTV